MTHGFLALNNNNQVLVSSDTRNLHFIGKYTTPTLDAATDYYGGMRRFRYRVTCNVTPVPFFTMPTGDYYGITGIRNVSGDQWDVEMLRSGTSAGYPELYVFSDPRGKNPPAAFGMQVLASDGTPAFDSRMKPLAVTGGLAVVHPSNPRPTFPYNLSSDNCNSMGSDAGGFFEPTEFNEYDLGTLNSKPMFHFCSMAQAEREASFSRSNQDCLGVDGYGTCWGYGTEEHWNSYYWCFYRGGIALDSMIHFHGIFNITYTPAIKAGWIPCYFGCHWTYDKDTSLAGIGIGGDGGASGSWPYANETINLASASVIIGDASRYD